MKKLALLLILAFSFALPAGVSAQFNLFPEECNGSASNNIDDPNNASACNTTGDDPISGEDGVINRVIGILSFVVGAASIIVLIFGGMKYVAANGDATKLASAKDTILYAMIGIAVFLSSQLIIRFVISRL